MSGELLAATDCAAPAEDDVPRPMNSPVTEPISAAATISPRLMFDSDRRTLGRSLARPWSLRRAKRMKTLVGEAMQELRPPNLRRPLALTFWPIRDQRKGSPGDWLVRNHS